MIDRQPLKAKEKWAPNDTQLRNLRIRETHYLRATSYSEERTFAELWDTRVPNLLRVTYYSERESADLRATRMMGRANDRQGIEDRGVTIS